jgi:hypothetical protein
MPSCLTPGTVPWLLARYRSSLFPEFVFEGWRGEGRLGRDAWPATVLLTLLFLRWSEEGMSRLGSTKRAMFDLQWRAAMGLQLGTQTPDEKTVREFESFLMQRHPASGVSRFLVLHEHIVRLCLDAGVVSENAVWATDSTPMWCYGAVLDTVRLLGDGTRNLARQWANATGQRFDEVAEQWKLPYLMAKSTKGAFGIDWRDEEQRSSVLEQVATGASHAVKQVLRHIETARSGRRARLLRRCQQLTLVISQNLETDATGRLVVAQKVAKDRIISLTDEQARHGRKTKNKCFDGFKFHLLGDVVSGLIAAVTVTAGNKHDGSVAHRLIRRAKKLCNDIEQVLGDTAYGGVMLRSQVQAECGVALLAPPPSMPRSGDDKLTRDDIHIDFVENIATCAAGVQTNNHRTIWANTYNCRVSYFKWPKKTCDSCRLSERCRGKRTGGHHIRLHPLEEELRQQRKEWQDPEARHAYRTRSQCERLVNQVTRHGGRQARAFGLRAAQLQAHLIAIRCNLQLLAKALAKSEDVKKQAA